MPLKSTVSPLPTSVPANETAAPGATARRTTTHAAAPTSVSSTGTTASAPRGSIPPVAIASAAPARDFARRRDAGRDRLVAAARSRTGADSLAPKLSAARTAKPSMFERSKPGTSIAALDVLGQHAAEGLRERHALAGQRRHVDRRAPAALGLVALEHLEELALLHDAAAGAALSAAGSSS